MAGVARATRPNDLDAAASYFSRLKFTSRVRVVEGNVTPRAVEAHFVWERQGPGTMPLGQRIIEAPDSMERFERRDPRVTFLAYAPAGSISRGSVLAASGGPGGLACASCHGTGYRGALGPPLAGRSPTFIARQLLAFRSGARREPEAAPMRQVASGLTDGQIIDLAAYLAAQKP
jgi:cytochrome c553